MIKYCFKKLNDKYVYKYEEINSIEYEIRDVYSCLLIMLYLINWFFLRYFFIGYWVFGAIRIVVFIFFIYVGWIGYYVFL